MGQGAEEGTGQEGKNRRGILKKGKLGWVARSQTGARSFDLLSQNLPGGWVWGRGEERRNSQGETRKGSWGGEGTCLSLSLSGSSTSLC